MRCQCCNASLTDFEATIKHGITRQYVELCSDCLKTIEAYIPIQVRQDLMNESDTAMTESLIDDNGYIDGGLDAEDPEDYWTDWDGR